MEKTEPGSSSREEGDLERQSLTGKENNKEERKENSCSKKKIAGLTLLIWVTRKSKTLIQKIFS